MNPPTLINPFDKHAGFTCVSKIYDPRVRYHYGPSGPTVYLWRKLSDAQRKSILTHHSFQTLWRPGKVLRLTSEPFYYNPGGVGYTVLPKSPEPSDFPFGELVGYNEKSFFQDNNDVTLAFYQIKGYIYLIAVWYDNQTQKRIA